ncbi:hypothetical protein [Streptomyces sp. NPDC101132]|uniref:hypothetical protein n=1 Tax=Streptomyces sp. NPDC101132 TaxID=3366110 RepID=UPI0037F5265C
MHENKPVVHHTVPLPPPAAPLVPQHHVNPPATLPEVQTVQLPDGRLITGYALTPTKTPEPYRARPAISPLAVNVAVGGIGFLAVCGGLLLLTTFLTALAALVQQLVILAAVLFGGLIVVAALRPGYGSRAPAGTTVHIRRAVIKRNHFHH